MNRRTGPDPVWVRYQPREALVAALRLSCEAELAHRRLCDLVWSGECPPRVLPGTLASVARVQLGDWQRIWLELQAVGWRLNGQRLAHPAVFAVLREARTSLARYAQAGRAGGCTTARNRRLSDAASDAPASLKPVNNTGQNTDKVIHNSNGSLLSAAPPKKAVAGERDFMREVQDMLELFSPATAQSELTNWGGWWRNRFRHDPRKARVVLADIRSLVTERRIAKTPTAAAQDLWKRLP